MVSNTIHHVLFEFSQVGFDHSRFHRVDQERKRTSYVNLLTLCEANAVLAMSSSIPKTLVF